jgi:hypothetical protein
LEEDGKDSVLLGDATENDAYILVHKDQNEELIGGKGQTEKKGKIFTEKDLIEVRKVKGLCTCSAIDMTFQVNYALPNKMKSTQYELYFKMF